MAMIKCSECGKEISDKADKCPNCGAPVLQNSTNAQADMRKNAQKQVNKNSTLGVTALIFSIIGCTLVIGVILAVIDLLQKDGKKKTCSVIALAMCGVWLIIGIAFNSGKGSNVNNTSQEINTAVQSDDKIEKSAQAETKENDKTATAKETIQPTESEVKTVIEYENEIQEDNDILERDEEVKEIFAIDLLENWDSYIGDRITVSFEVSSIREYDDEFKIESNYYDGINSRLKASSKDNLGIKENDWITVTGIVGDDIYDGLYDAKINDVGDKPKEIFTTAKADYDERKRIEAEEYEENFKNNVETPSYDDLLRYPDSYKEKQIKISAKIVRVEPDGVIFDGEIEATMGGETIALYDNRETKEPKMREGDSVILYGYGKGTTTVKVQDVSGWIPKTVDKYDIPAIDIRYIDFD